MIHYRKLPQKDITLASRLMAQAFKDYDYFKLISQNNKHRLDFLHSAFGVLLNHFHRTGEIIAAYKQGVLSSVAILQNPDQNEPSLWDYLLAGGLKLVSPRHLKASFDMLRLEHKAHQQLKTLESPFWYLAAFAVAPETKGQGLGSRTLREGVIPYLKEQGAESLAFITNSQINRQFYTKNGFTEFSQEEISLNGKAIGNWSYLMNLSE